MGGRANYFRMFLQAIYIALRTRPSRFSMTVVVV